MNFVEQANIPTGATNKTTVKILAGVIKVNSTKSNAKQVVRKSGSNVEDIRSLKGQFSDKVNSDSVAFTADYHRPIHHPPKNNK